MTQIQPNHEQDRGFHGSLTIFNDRPVYDIALKFLFLAVPFIHLFGQKLIWPIQVLGEMRKLKER